MSGHEIGCTKIIFAYANLKLTQYFQQHTNEQNLSNKSHTLAPTMGVQARPRKLTSSLCQARACQRYSLSTLLAPLYAPIGKSHGSIQYGPPMVRLRPDRNMCLFNRIWHDKHHQAA
ncbi:MAG TPA: hypothetical protein DCQ06_10620 [Myxococcales bacterium]|nr:hypothetical protein [Myxococcales bacterium]HAN32039.1 hypothetical protein [Myxococcales bacterium]